MSVEQNQSAGDYSIVAQILGDVTVNLHSGRELMESPALEIIRESLGKLPRNVLEQVSHDKSFVSMLTRMIDTVRKFPDNDRSKDFAGQIAAKAGPLYLPVYFEWVDDVIRITASKASTILDCKMAENQWIESVREMEDFIGKKRLSMHGYCAVGIQNFMTIDDVFCAGVRLKGKYNSTSAPYGLVAQGHVNTCYKLIRKADD